MQVKGRPEVSIDTPIEGHYLITGHQPRSAYSKTAGHLVVEKVCHICPEVTDDILEAIIADRKIAHRPPAAEAPPEAPKRNTRKKGDK